jgi:hypothetical protein
LGQFIGKGSVEGGVEEGNGRDVYYRHIVLISRINQKAANSKDQEAQSQPRQP